MKYTIFIGRLSLILLICLLDNLPGKCQSLSPTVISSSGAFYSNTAGMLSSTIGEMTMVQTFTAGGSILTQGFQQDFDFNVGLTPVIAGSLTYVFPNPTTGNLYIRIASGYIGAVEAEVFDVEGRLVYRKSYAAEISAMPLSLEIGQLVTGLYFVKVITGKELFSAKINLTKI